MKLPTIIDERGCKLTSKPLILDERGEQTSKTNDIHYRQMCQIQAFWNSPADPTEPLDPAEPAEVVSASAAQTSLPHAPGVRMTGVQQTPSNYPYYAYYPYDSQLFLIIL